MLNFEMAFKFKSLEFFPHKIQLAIYLLVDRVRINQKSSQLKLFLRWNKLGRNERTFLAKLTNICVFILRIIFENCFCGRFWCGFFFEKSFRFIKILFLIFRDVWIDRNRLLVKKHEANFVFWRLAQQLEKEDCFLTLQTWQLIK